MIKMASPRYLSSLVKTVGEKITSSITRLWIVETTDLCTHHAQLFTEKFTSLQVLIIESNGPHSVAGRRFEEALTEDLDELNEMADWAYRDKVSSSVGMYVGEDEETTKARICQQSIQALQFDQEFTIYLSGKVEGAKVRIPVQYCT